MTHSPDKLPSFRQLEDMVYGHPDAPGHVPDAEPHATMHFPNGIDIPLVDAYHCNLAVDGFRRAVRRGLHDVNVGEDWHLP